jgi:hypothetical protein
MKQSARVCYSGFFAPEEKSHNDFDNPNATMHKSRFGPKSAADMKTHF